jgi:RNA polymerase sigma factor (sigma-70 family)
VGRDTGGADGLRPGTSNTGTSDPGADGRRSDTDAGTSNVGADAEALAREFEVHRPRLRAVAYRLLGSLAGADDAVQEAWIRLSRRDSGEVRDLGAWLTAAVGQICLDVLESRPPERGIHVPDPIMSPIDRPDPESEALLAGSLGLALMVVLDTLDPAERLAFVLHDMFAVPFEAIAPMLDRTPADADRLAEHVRRRVREAGRLETDLARQREVVEAFLAASRDGDLETLLNVFDPEVVLRADYGGATSSRLVRGAEPAARGARAFGRFRYGIQLALVNGALGAMTITHEGAVGAVMGITVRDGRIAELNLLGDPRRLSALGFPVAA